MVDIFLFSSGIAENTGVVLATLKKSRPKTFNFRLSFVTKDNSTTEEAIHHFLNNVACDILF